MLSGTAIQLAEYGADWIDARFSCLGVMEALEQVNFMNGRADIAFWWPGK